MNYNDSDEQGYILECDIEYPKELHDSHNSYPLLPNKQVIKYD